MGKLNFSELVNVSALEKMAESLYAISGIPVGIIDVDGTIYVKIGWQDICTKFHRGHQETNERCTLSDKSINENLIKGKYIEYKCLNNMWDIGVPIIIAGEHLATIFMGQFFYDDEEIDRDFFYNQALQFGFDVDDYMEALDRVPRYSKKKVQDIIGYYQGLVNTLAESGLSRIENEFSKRELAKNQKYLYTIYNSVNDAIFVHDFYGEIIDCNQTASTMFGYANVELINMNINDLMSEKSILTKIQLMQSFQKARKNDTIVFECIFTTKDGNEFWVELNTSVIKFDENEEIITTVRDITDRKLAELASQKEAHELENLRTEFFGNISHELKTPLNIIFGVTQIVEMEMQNRDKPLDREKVLNNLKIEKQNCFRLLRLINNLIDSTKLDSGYFELNMVNCNIINVVEEITMSVAEYINSNNISLTFDTDVEEKMIACDLDKIERIILNLLSNAVKFTPAGGEIFVNILDGEEYITITVEDTGIGIPPQKLNIIFDRFRQVDKSFARNHEGSGIGLSLVKSLVEMHSGDIDVESKYGVGTKFIIKLPIRIADNITREESNKQVNSMIDNCVERIRIEFSDIYNMDERGI
ncbi:sensor histidine kinase [Clostridium sp. 'White wine YQ']|uniref:sensor histidine kinase n=1 Tax=Clostridium sp. 'White wine YQ' TaxID=3027474 RepID=UPI00236702E3|nr:PocR ligand-binding domain-containing protein [Clostridium sp. 'White wine YQ']MDD7794236.1 PocR ligand-binding domain-containing protein [Clostridium sp. 'White wine YQ']